MSNYTSLFGGANSYPGPSAVEESIHQDVNFSDDSVFPSSLPLSTDEVDEQDDHFPELEERGDDHHNYLMSPDRPNRFTGNVNRWRYLTQNERSIAASVDRLEDDDLAIHLYNVHSLKRRLYRTDLDEEAAGDSSEERPRKRKVERWHRKEQWMKSHDLEGNENWFPRRQWTEWPMEPDVVPRPGERLVREWEGDREEEKWTVERRDDEKWKPSLEIEEVLLAEMLRKARDRFEARGWEEDDEEGDNHNTEATREQRRSRRTDESGNFQSMDRDSDSQLPRNLNRSRRRRQPKPLGTLTASGRTVSHADSSKTDGFRNDRTWSRSGAGAIADEETKEGSSSRPVVMADDDKARRILQIPIQHVLTKLDDLLLGLHHARQNQLDLDGTDSGTDTQSSRESSVVQQQRGSRRSSQPRTRRSRSLSRRRSKPISKLYRPRTLSEIRPRDWSEVLGIATMTGWDSDVVKRATARCSRLFGECMEFRAIGGDVNEAQSQEASDVENAVTAGVHVDGFMMPIERPVDQGKKQGKRRGRAVSKAPAHASIDGEVGDISSA